MDHLQQYMPVHYHMCACAHEGVHTAEATVGGGREPTAKNKPTDPSPEVEKIRPRSSPDVGCYALHSSLSSLALHNSLVRWGPVLFLLYGQGAEVK